MSIQRKEEISSHIACYPWRTNLWTVFAYVSRPKRPIHLDTRGNRGREGPVSESQQQVARKSRREPDTARESITETNLLYFISIHRVSLSVTLFRSARPDYRLIFAGVEKEHQPRETSRKEDSSTLSTLFGQSFVFHTGSRVRKSFDTKWFSRTMVICHLHNEYSQSKYISNFRQYCIFFIFIFLITNFIVWNNWLFLNRGWRENSFENLQIQKIVRHHYH